jgi:hypothetical protein
MELIILVPGKISFQYILLNHNTDKFLLDIILVMQVSCCSSCRGRNFVRGLKEVWKSSIFRMLCREASPSRYELVFVLIIS